MIIIATDVLETLIGNIFLDRVKIKVKEITVTS